MSNGSGKRTADAEDPAIPGHWGRRSGIGNDCKSAVGALVERATEA